MGDLLLKEVSGHLLRLTLNRPEKHNSLTPELLELLGAALIEARDDDDVRVVLLTGAGDKAFCAGMDLRNVAPQATFVDQFGPAPVHLARGFELWKPVVAAINGYALGGGLELALACDIRIASDDASFGLPEVGIGSIPGAGGTQRLVRHIPQAAAMRMLLVGDRVDAQTAQRWGLVSDVVPARELLGAATDIAQRIAMNAPLSVQAVKQAAIAGADMALRDGLRLERTLFNLLRDTHDRTEGRTAFAEERAPRFEGR